MSGLCGWIGTDGDVQADKLVLARMADGLPQVGTCSQHSAASAGCGLALRAHPRVAFWSNASDLIVALQGYPQWSDPHLAQEASAAGHASALASAYHKFGKGLLQYLHGPFAFAVLDPRKRAGLLAIDRLGIEPLCYAHAPGKPLVFGATTDAIKAHDSVTGELSLQAVFDFLYFVDRIPAPETIYQDIRKLTPGQCLSYEQGQISVETYWTMPYQAAAGGNLKDLSEELMERLQAATAASLTDEAPDGVGVFLSGGLDSSTVLGLASKLMPDQARAFTIGFDAAGFDETAYAALAARHFGASHEVIRLDPQRIADQVTDIVGIYDEPFGNSSAVPAYFCALAAREAGVEVMLAGDGGDELFAGNSSYVDDRVFDHYDRLPAAFRRGVLDPLVKALPAAERVALFRKAKRYVGLAKLPVSERLYRDNMFEQVPMAEVFASDFLAAVDQAAPLRRAEEIYRAAASPDKLHRMLFLDMHLVLADSDLRKVSRMCELAGLRVRYPFLDEDLASFSARVPPAMLMKGGQLRHFYKQAMRGFLPPEILAKEKHGFGLPFVSLMMEPGPVRDLVCDSLSGLAKRGYVQRGFLEKFVDDLRAGRTTAISGAAWDLMILEKWLSSRSIG